MKKIILIILLTFHLSSNACDVCQRANEKKLFGSFIHGNGELNGLGYLGIALTIVITIYTLFMSIKYLIQPKEKMKSHIKYKILEN